MPVLVTERSSPVLARLDEAWRALEQAQTLQEVVPLVRGAELLREYVRQSKGGLRQQNEAARFKVEASAKAGEMLMPPDSHQGKGRPREKMLDGQTFTPTLDDLGVSRFESHYWQKIARVPVETRQAFYRLVAANVTTAEMAPSETAKPGEMEVTTAGTLRYHQMGVHKSSEEDEWLTPPEIIAATLDVLGAIDLDPCSNTFGEPNVPAAERFTEADDGLTRPWRGRVYLNPPYGAAIAAWVRTLRTEYDEGRVTQAIALVPARTDTEWWAELRDTAVCFVRGRLRFSGASNAAPFPSAVAYFGPGRSCFAAAFGGLGDIWVRVSDC